ncbi:hypothetical protein ES319_D11G334400v1 [Gossypium barbadense]|uniref:Probable purine permease n=4 Tax=Gossypium TaxID=3633 RepID=A0A5J5PIR2_GOSBA|nr:hypothetical protein ES319_D11G334400v1 [Gossypium barbadense]TYG47625.1 hypothetical protein ES288_D11G354600v1 [Gossypium darwinii]TYH46731.1 hypothetical protein ES332_D11G358800v1 [Gossypium tomentosum]
MEIIEAQHDSKSGLLRFKTLVRRYDLPRSWKEMKILQAYLSTTVIPSFNPDNLWKPWLLIALNILFLLAGQSAAVLLTKFYFNNGGKSKWMASLMQTAGFPLLYLPLLFFPSFNKQSPSSSNNITHYVVYFSLGCLLAIDNFMYTVGVKPLSISTYSLLCASQLVFNAVFSVVINCEKLGILTLNSIIFITVSASMVAIHPDSSETKRDEKNPVRKNEHTIGFISTVGASAGYALLLSLTQFSFDKILKKDRFSVVFEMQIYTSLVSSFVCLLGLFLSLEFMDLKSEMEKFDEGKVIYVVSLIGIALAWQICTVGVVGLIYLVSSLFSNVVSMLSLPFVPVVGVLLYEEKMDAIKVLAMLFTLWGFASYIYQQYLDDKKSKKKESQEIEDSESEV